MTAVMAVVRLRVAGYLRAYVAIAPTLAGLVVLAVLYGGGRARPEEAYGVSAIVLFPVIAWQVKIMLDAEPDVQRRLVRVAAGSADREIAAGLIAAAACALPTIGLGLALPWVLDGVTLRGSVGLAPALALGVWVHLLSALAAIAVGAWASRPVSRTPGIAVSVLTGAGVLTIVLGLAGGPAPWLAPPLLAVARSVTAGVTTSQLVGLTAWACAWSAVVAAGYWTARRRAA